MNAGQKCVICRGGAHRYACDTCVDTIRRKLREIEMFAAWLATPTMLEPARGGTGRRAPGFGSRPPLRLTALAMNDPRSKTEPPPVDEGRGIGLDEDTGAWPIFGTLRVLADHVREAQHHPAPLRRTLAGEIGYLLGQIEWAASQPGVADFAAQIRKLHSQARTVAHDTPPKPLGTCLSVGCEGQVFPPPPRGDTAHCSSCGRAYTGLGLVKLRLAQEAG